MRTLTLCNEGLLPLHLVWRPRAAAAMGPTTEASTVSAGSPATAGPSSYPGAFCVSPLEAVVPAKSSCSFCFAVHPRLLPSTAVGPPGGCKASSSSFWCEMFLQVSGSQP